MSRKESLDARFLEYARNERLFPGGSVVLAAVSGGIDSMVMLHCLARTAGALGIRGIAVAHVEHGIRPEAPDDAMFVREAASDMGLDFHLRSVDVPAYAREKGRTLEDAARVLRYEALASIAAELGGAVIATGHTASDQAETVLMRMIRGTGPLGLAGVSPRRDDGVVRPLLCATRTDVAGYAAEHGIRWVEDESNRDEGFQRNRIRSELVPLLMDMNPRIESALSDLAEAAAELGGWVAEQAAGLVVTRAGDRRLIPTRVIGDCPPALLPYVVMRAFEDLTGRPLGLSRTHVRAVVRMAAGGPGTKCHLPRGVTAKRTREGLVFEKGEAVRR